MFVRKFILYFIVQFYAPSISNWTNLKLWTLESFKRKVNVAAYIHFMGKLTSNAEPVTHSRIYLFHVAYTHKNNLKQTNLTQLESPSQNKTSLSQSTKRTWSIYSRINGISISALDYSYFYPLGSSYTNPQSHKLSLYMQIYCIKIFINLFWRSTGYRWALDIAP